MIDIQFKLNSAFFGPQKSPSSVLWLPSFENHKLSHGIDWLMDLRLSELYYQERKTWSPELQQNILENQLPLDKDKAHSERILFQLPKGFKCEFGLIIPSCHWNSPEDVYKSYEQSSKELQAKLVQCPNIWGPAPSKLLAGVEWIKS